MTVRDGSTDVSPDDLKAEDLVGFRVLQRARKMLAGLHGSADHPNRKLHFDEYALALILYFFNPLLTSLRGLQKATEFAKVQKALGIRRMSLGSMSESVRVFDPDLLAGVFQELASRAPDRPMDPRLKDLKQQLTVVDGTILRALPKMAWAVWLRDTDRGAKAHIHFELPKSAPVSAELTAGNVSEIVNLRKRLQAGRLYVMDRGYRSLDLLQDIVDADSSFVVRWHANAVYEVIEEHEVTAEAAEAGVHSDRTVRLGGERIRDKLSVPVRLVEVRVPEKPPRGLGYPVKKVVWNRSARRPPGEAYTIWIVTDRLNLPADVIALIYMHRWTVELFFRVLKGMMGCRHLLSHSLEGVTIQLYAALMATLLLGEYTGIKPNKRTFELVAFHLMGWIDEEEFHEHLAKLKEAASKKP